MDANRLPRYLAQADCVLVSPDLQELPACSAILAKESQVFDDVLSSANFEKNTAGQRKLPLAEEIELLTFLRNATHDGDFEFSVEEPVAVFELARVAHIFSVKSVLRLVDSKLCNSEARLHLLLEQTSICSTLYQAATLELSGVLDKAVKTVLQNPAWLQNDSMQDLRQLPRELLALLLTNREAATAAELESCRDKIVQVEAQAQHNFDAGQLEVATLQRAWMSACQSNIKGSWDGMNKKEAVAMRAAVRGAALNHIAKKKAEFIRCFCKI